MTKMDDDRRKDDDRYRLGSSYRPVVGRWKKGRWWLALAAITLLAFLVRFYRLADFPPGLHYDEAFNGLDAYALLSTPLRQWPLFFTGNFGREPLFIYLQAVAQAILGPSPTTLRLAPALIGALLTPALAWLAWELAPSLGLRHRRRLALWSGTAALAMLWSQIFARYAIRAELFVLIEILLWASLWRAWRTNRLRWQLLTGVLAGLSFYTYLPARLLPLALIPPGLLAMWRYRPQLRARLPEIAAGLLAGVLLALPLALYFVRNPLSFATRAGQVSVFGQGGLAAIGRNLAATLGMAFIEGDANARNNIPGRPVLDWLMAIPFLAGLGYLLRYALRPAALFLLSWLGVMLLPTILSDYAPAYHRALGTLPVFAIAIALGLSWAFELAERRGSVGSRITTIAGWIVLLIGVALSWQAFAAWSALPDLFYARDVGFLQLAAQLADDPERVYVSPRGSDHPTVRYALLSSGASPDLHGFDDRICVRVSPGQATRYLFLDGEDQRGPTLLQDYLPESAAAPLISDMNGQPWASELVQPATGEVQFPEMTAQPTTLSDGVEFLGYWLSQPELTPGERLYVRLFWRAEQTPAQDYTSFVHLLSNERAIWKRVEGVDARPGGGSCATTSWLPGEVIVDELQFVIPPDVWPYTSYYLALGFYTPADGQRLMIPEYSGDQILIGPLSISTE